MVKAIAKRKDMPRRRALGQAFRERLADEHTISKADC